MAFISIDTLTKKATIAGTEKLPVSITEYIDLSSIADFAKKQLGASSIGDEKKVLNQKGEWTQNFWANFVSFLSGYSPTGSETTGTTWYDSDTHTLVTVLENGVVLQHGQEVHLYAKASIAIQNGKPGSIVDVAGSFTSIAPTDLSTNALGFIGLATHDIAANSFGYFTTKGVVRGINTTGLIAGKKCYVGEDGNLTSTPVSAGKYRIEVGVVEYVHATQGRINVTGMVIPFLDDLSNVDGSISTIDDANEMLIKDISTNVWKKITWSDIKATNKTYFDTLYVQKVVGKGLSTEDYTTAEKSKVANVPLNTNTELAAKVDKVVGKSLILDTEITRLSGVTNQTLGGLGGEAVANKKTTLTDSDTDYPTTKAVKTAIDANNQTWVGVVIDPTLSSSEPAPKSTVTAYRATELMRTGNLYYHKFGNSRIFNAFQPAIVDRATRKVAWYLNKNNPSLKADGTTSAPDWNTQNIAVIVPDLYRRITVLDVGTGKYEVAYDIMPFDGAQLWHEESAHSPGFASVDRTLTQLVSVVSDDVRFRGGNNNGAADGLPSTQLGRPATAISRINFENYAAAAGWETGNIADRTMWHELTALYFANTNIQLDYTTTLTAEGYPQGGLGAGVTAWNSSRWSYRNGYYPIHKVGEGFMTIGCNTGVKSMTDEKYYVGAISSVSAGNLVATGHFAAGAGWSASYIGYTVQNLQTLAEATITGKTDDDTLTLSADIFTTAGQWYWIKGVTYSYQIPVFFGLEHLYGEIWDWVSGVNIEVSATVENGGTGESKAYVCTDFSKRAATITPDYTYIGLTPRADDYIKELYRDFAIAKVNTGASSATFMSDRGYYGNLPSSGSVVRGLLFGANASHGVSAGVRSSFAHHVPTYANSSFGARLRAKIEK